MRYLFLLLSLLLLPAVAHASPPCGSDISGTVVMDASITCGPMDHAYRLLANSTLDCDGFSIIGMDPLPATCEDNARAASPAITASERIT